MKRIHRHCLTCQAPEDIWCRNDHVILGYLGQVPSPARSHYATSIKIGLEAGSTGPHDSFVPSADHDAACKMAFMRGARLGSAMTVIQISWLFSALVVLAGICFFLFKVFHFSFK